MDQINTTVSRLVKGRTRINAPHTHTSLYGVMVVSCIKAAWSPAAFSSLISQHKKCTLHRLSLQAAFLPPRGGGGVVCVCGGGSCRGKPTSPVTYGASKLHHIIQSCLLHGSVILKLKSRQGNINASQQALPIRG